jgi:hypothetical protein
LPSTTLAKTHFTIVFLVAQAIRHCAHIPNYQLISPTNAGRPGKFSAFCYRRYIFCYRQGSNRNTRSDARETQRPQFGMYNACSLVAYICTRAIHTDMRDLPPLQGPKEDPCPHPRPRPLIASLPTRGQVSLPRGLTSQAIRAIRVPITQDE